MTKEKTKTKEKENLFLKHKKTGWYPFTEYRVNIRVLDLVGGLPMNEKLVESWVNATNKGKKEEDREAIRDAHIETLPDAVEEKKEKQGIGFARVNGKLAIEGRQVKAMLKEVANIIKDTVPSNAPLHAKKGTGISALRNKVAEQYILLDREEPDRITERPIHVTTPRGPRDSIKVCEICDNVDVEFTLKLHNGMGKQAVPEKALVAILDYAQINGLGADRSQGFGTFETFSVVKMD
jgi:hypothetical protein